MQQKTPIVQQIVWHSSLNFVCLEGAKWCFDQYCTDSTDNLLCTAGVNRPKTDAQRLMNPSIENNYIYMAEIQLSLIANYARAAE